MNVLQLTEREREVLERALREWEPNPVIYRKDRAGQNALALDISVARELAAKVRIL